jgi:hypothetical protein
VGAGVAREPERAQLAHAVEFRPLGRSIFGHGFGRVGRLLLAMFEHGFGASAGSRFGLLRHTITTPNARHCSIGCSFADDP